MEREAAEALESGSPPDAAVAAQYAAFAERQAALLQVRGPLCALIQKPRSQTLHTLELAHLNGSAPVSHTCLLRS